jgi:hypothetical protein
LAIRLSGDCPRPFFTFTWAPATTRRDTTRLRLAAAAACSAVSPPWFEASAIAPVSSSASTDAAPALAGRAAAVDERHACDPGRRRSDARGQHDRGRAVAHGRADRHRRPSARTMSGSRKRAASRNVDG